MPVGRVEKTEVSSAPKTVLGLKGLRRHRPRHTNLDSILTQNKIVLLYLCEIYLA